MFIPLHDGNALRHIERQYVTLLIIAANCLIWLVMGTPAISEPEAVRAAVYSYGFIPAVVNGYKALPPELAAVPGFATYVTYAFFHGDFMHLAGNMLFVWVFGDNVEDAMGHLRFLFFYLACAAFGAFVHALMDPDSTIPLIGASGAAAGIVGAYLLLHPRIRIWVLALGRIPLRIPAIFVLGAWVAFQFWQFFANNDANVSWAAHIGGVVAGLVLIVFMRRPGVHLFDRTDNVVVAASPDGSASTASSSRSDRMRGTSVPGAGRAPDRMDRGGNDPEGDIPDGNDIGRRWGRGPGS